LTENEAILEEGIFEEGKVLALPVMGPGLTAEPQDEAMIVDLDGFEGPLDVLLNLARTQKVDLMSISILALAEQFIAFIENARRLRLELAADYLVMAAWLAYLKSRLLLPPEPGDEGPSGEEMAAILAFRLQRLEAMRNAAALLMGRDRLGRDVFARGMPEGVRVVTKSNYVLSWYELLKGYSEGRTRSIVVEPMHIRRPALYSMEEALVRLRRLLGSTPDWMTLERFLPEDFRESGAVRSAFAATFSATLEMVRAGQAEIQQNEVFGPIHIRGRVMPRAED
jgi:segregation and condensation protein A